MARAGADGRALPLGRGPRLLPCCPYRLQGEHGLLKYLDKVLKTKGHAVLCVAEGAGQVRACSAQGAERGGGAKRGGDGAAGGVAGAQVCDARHALPTG